MKKRVLSLGLVLIFLLSLCPAALAANLSGATVTLQGVPLVYNGTAQKPEVSVTLDGQTLYEGADYTLAYANNINAGEGLVTVTGIGAYTGSKTVKFTILPCPLTAEDFAGQPLYSRAFDKTWAANPTVQATIHGKPVTLFYESAAFQSRFVGRSDVTLTNPWVEGNYRLADGFALTIPGQITPAETTVRNGQVAAGEKLDLSTLVENGGESHYFEIRGEKYGSSIQGRILTAGSQEAELTIWAAVDGRDFDHDGMDEYTGLEKTITVTVTGADQEEVPPVDQKEPQAPLVISGGEEVTYGQPLQLSVTGGSTNNPVSWEFGEFVSNGAATISPDGLLTPVRAGKVWVTAVMAGDETYQEVRSNTMEITIRQAPITITVGNKAALVGDEVPDLTEADYTVSGLLGNDRLAVLPALAYETTPDMTREGQVAILASGAVVPDGGNYDPNIQYVPGKLTIGPVYPITIGEAEGGTVTADQTQAPEGAVVTLTIQPEEGYVLESLKVASGSDLIQTAQMGEGTMTFTMPAGGVLIAPTFMPETPQNLPFTDVTPEDWFYESVAYVYAEGLMNGTSDTTFTPGGTTTRGMIVTILYRLAGSPETAAWSPFQDVSSNQYYAAPIAWAAWNGIVNGKTATAFAPNDPITREQMAAILYRYAGYQGMEVTQNGDLSQFTDQGKISGYAREALSWANGEGLITGKGGGILDPQGPATRAQVAAIFQRFCEGLTR